MECLSRGVRIDIEIGKNALSSLDVVHYASVPLNPACWVFRPAMFRFFGYHRERRFRTLSGFQFVVQHEQRSNDLYFQRLCQCL